MTKLNRRRFTALALGSITAPPALASTYDNAACTRFAETTNWEREIVYSASDSQSQRMRVNFRHKGYGLEFTMSFDEALGDRQYMTISETMFRTDSFKQWFERMPKYEWDLTDGQRSKALVDLVIYDPATDWEWFVEGRPVKNSFYDGSESRIVYRADLEASKQKTEQLMGYLAKEDRTGLEISSAGIAPDGKQTVFLEGKMSSTGLRQLIGGMEGAIKDLERTATPEKCESSCFLTTACCTALGRADDGFELSTLRGFRDGWMVRQGTGRADVAEYYRIAPAICAAIEADPRGKRELYRIYYGTVLPCVALIKLGQNRLAYRLYRHLVRRLEAKYLGAASSAV